MRSIELDGRDFDNRAKLHRVLKEALALPEYYGNNLDALNDCLAEMKDTTIVLRYPEAMLNSLGDYGRGLIAVFKAQAAERADFRFQILKQKKS